MCFCQKWKNSNNNMMVFYKKLQLCVTKEHTSHIGFDFMVYATSVMLYVFVAMCLSLCCCMVFKLWCRCCTLTYFVCVLQDHKYVVQAEVLYKSWDLDESQLAFVHMLRERNELRGIYSKQSHPTVSHITLLKRQIKKTDTVQIMFCFSWNHKIFCYLYK